MGDPAGIGLEIAARTWAERDGETPPFYVIGDQEAAMRAAHRAGIALTTMGVDESMCAQASGLFRQGLPFVPEALSQLETPGAPCTANSRSVISAIERGVSHVRSGLALALVTLPIAKSVLYDAGFRHPGHTEFIAHLTADMAYVGSRGPVMMLATEGLRVALVTIHAPLSDVAATLTTADIVAKASVVLNALSRDFGVTRPRLALAGLNPHAGESGSIGREEIEVINPAAAQLRAEGHDVSDARPADTLFHAEARARYDAVLCMYHDQGLIPLKMLDFWGGVNITLGLPVVRTSPDHGTGFDIAGKGVARADSFRAALRAAADIAAYRAARA
ncbi:MAG: 4-hydroxythreonine-4-phosphate dehydrogenase [Alphaproteobacteria bacterium]|nr:MAG: 4-hydroxythreonine-4-phosphate dehydrogenase [Caulobacteraceae bacterium]TPW02095.1 MAG: 4-hydroxythreonine-4-phosphate dehydrogenase [Alphaproteobacteria bacterium]